MLLSVFAAALLTGHIGAFVWPFLAAALMMFDLERAKPVVDAGSLALIPAVFVPHPVFWLIFPMITLVIAVLWAEADRRHAQPRWSLRGRRTYQTPLLPRQAWARLVPGEGRPGQHWSQTYAATIPDRDDPETLYVHFEDDAGQPRLEIVTRLVQQPYRVARFAVDDHDAPNGRQTYISLHFAHLSSGTRISAEVEVTHLRWTEWLALWLDDSFGRGAEAIDTFDPTVLPDAAQTAGRPAFRFDGVRRPSPRTRHLREKALRRAP